MKHNSFTRLFEEYGWEVEELSDNSYVASNETFFVPFSLNYMGYASAVSYIADDKEKFIEKWERRNTPYLSPIGFFAWQLYANGNKEFFHVGKVCNHDHSTCEIENWLKRLKGKGGDGNV